MHAYLAAVSGSRCTKRMCAIIGLDIRNAFNKAGWDKIMLALEDLIVPLYLRRVNSSYLMDRNLLYDTEDGTHSYNITGVPHGSVLGSPIWNVQYDGLLRQPLPDRVSIIAYADDVALTVVAKSIKEVQHLGHTAIEVVRDWLNDHGQPCCRKDRGGAHFPNKKEGIRHLYGQRQKDQDGETIKYQGVTIDARLSLKTTLRTED